MDWPATLASWRGRVSRFVSHVLASHVDCAAAGTQASARPRLSNGATESSVMPSL
jgi:hypothetical protein